MDSNTLCQHPGCHDLASRKVATLISHSGTGRSLCVFRPFCAAHLPSSSRYSAPITSTPLPTHKNPAGQIHVPRVWEITGKAPVDRRRDVREWNRAHQQLHPLPVHAYDFIPATAH